VSNPEWVVTELSRFCREEIVRRLFPGSYHPFDSGKRVVALDIDGKRRPTGHVMVRSSAFGAEKREVARDELSCLLDEIRPLGFANIPLYDVTEGFDDSLLGVSPTSRRQCS